LFNRKYYAEKTHTKCLLIVVTKHFKGWRPWT